GSLTLTIGASQIELQQGESATFESGEVHFYEPRSDSVLPAKVLMVCLDEFGQRKVGLQLEDDEADSD
nr:hypothetical protein [Fimbriimonadaceae bacterium]